MRFEDLAGLVARHPFERLAVPEEDHRRDAHHAVLHRQLGGLVHIHRQKVHPAGVVPCHLHQYRLQHPARPAPGCAELDQHGPRGPEDFGFKIGLGNGREAAQGRVLSWVRRVWVNCLHYTRLPPARSRKKGGNKGIFIDASPLTCYNKHLIMGV